MDEVIRALLDFFIGLAAGVTDVVQRVVILVADALLMLFAVIAISQDWTHTCGETMHLYGAACIVMCIVDMSLELLRCTSERSLTRLQHDFQPDASPQACDGNAGLLDANSISEGLGQGCIDGAAERSPSVAIASGTLGRGVRQLKASQQKRVSNLHFWSIVFAVMVSMVFSFFSAHDEDCSERAPSLYSYIHVFTYAFILRLGVVILWLCCRTVQNYEDAANFALQSRQQGVPLQPLSF